MLDPPVYFLTWTTYGTWLPGDERGWVDHKREMAADRLQGHDERREDLARDRLNGPPVTLGRAERSLVERTIREVCDHSQWRLLAVNCRTNHVHVVVVAFSHTPEQVMNSLKSWSSRRLNEYVGQGHKRTWWTRHGSTRWLNREDDVHAAIDYALNRQDDRTEFAKPTSGRPQPDQPRP